jgi:peptide deformylase
MSLLDIGNPLLLRKCGRVTFPLDNQTKNEIKCIFDTFAGITEASELSANEMGINKQIVIYRPPFKANPKILINPSIDIVSDDMMQCTEEWLSLPEVKLDTLRHAYVHVSGFNPNGELEEIDAYGSVSQSLQHAIDHTQGTSFFHRSKAIINKTEKTSNYLRK